MGNEHILLDIRCQHLEKICQLDGFCAPFGGRVGECTFLDIFKFLPMLKFTKVFCPLSRLSSKSPVLKVTCPQSRLSSKSQSSKSPVLKVACPQSRVLKVAVLKATCPQSPIGVSLINSN